MESLVECKEVRVCAARSIADEKSCINYEPGAWDVCAHKRPVCSFDICYFEESRTLSSTWKCRKSNSNYGK